MSHGADDLDAGSVHHKILLGCMIVGCIGVVILLTVVAGSALSVQAAAPMTG